MVGGCPHRLKLFKQVDLSFNITFRANNASIMTCVDTVQLFIHLLMAFQIVASSAFRSNFASPGALTQGPQRTVSPNSPELGPRRRYVETGGSTEIRLEALIHHRQRYKHWRRGVPEVQRYGPRIPAFFPAFGLHLCTRIHAEGGTFIVTYLPPPLEHKISCFSARTAPGGTGCRPK